MHSSSTTLLSMRCRALVTALLTLALLDAAKPQDSALKPSDVAPLVQRLMDVEVGFDKMVLPGMSIEAKEISRTGKSGDDLVVQYHIFVKGVPANTLFQEISWPVNHDKPFSPLEGISVGKDGILMCAGRTPEQCGDPKKPDDPIEFITKPRKGEPSRVAFIAQDFRIGTVIVPDPIEASDRGCTLNAVRLTSKFELAFISGSGYPPNADVHYRVSGEATNDEVIKSDESGTIRFSMIAYPGNKTKGTVTVKITESKCSPELSYPWGTI